MKKVSLIIMSIFYIVAGINHFINPAFYKKIMPSYIPWHIQFIYTSGILEIVFGILIIPSVTRKAAAWGIIILLVAIFPANVYMATNNWDEDNPNLWILILRLPLQFLLIWWAYSFTKDKRLKN